MIEQIIHISATAGRTYSQKGLAYYEFRVKGDVNDNDIIFFKLVEWCENNTRSHNVVSFTDGGAGVYFCGDKNIARKFKTLIDKCIYMNKIDLHESIDMIL